MHPFRASIIVPVYDRPSEVDELLASLEDQTESPLEVIIVEDGSTVPCGHVVERYRGRLPVRYLTKTNSGPGPSRDHGARQALGDLLIFLDSDVVLPPGYMAAVRHGWETDPVDLFGGPDRAHPSDTPLQRAIGHVMASFLTTGGIRGGAVRLERYHPRSFNMGVAKAMFERVGGFSAMRFGEDIDLSIRIHAAGGRSRLFSDAWVYHKRRARLSTFWKQVVNSGIARINLHLRHPGSLRVVHLLPGLFVVGVVLCLLGAMIGSAVWLLPLALFTALVFLEAAWCTRDAQVAALAMAAAWVQLTGYGTGFVVAAVNRLLLGRKEFHAFGRTFYD